jgi:hypothetical protein
MTRMLIGSRNASTSSAVTTVKPSGFFTSEAIFATSLLGPSPTEHVSPSRSAISRLTVRARSTAASKLPSEERSRYASSMLASSKASPAPARMAMMRWDIST